jgi:hypothetical protein
MAQCITCGTELHPERAQKYNYCMAPACQEKNAKGLTVVAIGMNKAADELVILDERTREALAHGKYQDQRRGSFGPPAPAHSGARSTAAAATSGTTEATSGTTEATPGTTAAATPGTTAAAASGTVAASGTTPATPAPGAAAATAPARTPGRPARRRRPQPSRPTPASATRPRWTASQERLALLYNEQGLRPDEIADKLGVSTYLATQIVLAARSHRKA